MPQKWLRLRRQARRYGGKKAWSGGNPYSDAMGKLHTMKAKYLDWRVALRYF
jgi:hypothetical protein